MQNRIISCVFTRIFIYSYKKYCAIPAKTYFDEFWLLKDYESLSTIIISMISPWLFLMVPEIKVKNRQGHTEWIEYLCFVLESTTFINEAAEHRYFYI